MNATTYADILCPSTRQKALAYDAALVIGGSLFIALCAQFTIHVGPVPITGQTLGVLLTGLLLGSRRGSLSVLAYLAQGIAGLPVFAPGGAPGLARLVGPTGGYLLGFVAAAYVAGLLAERGWDRRPATALLAMLTGDAIIYAFGLPWLTLFVGVENVLPVGLYPFVIGDLAKAFLAAALLPIGWRLLNSRHERHSP
jgi:biotin transport system substrate-specific component